MAQKYTELFSRLAKGSKGAGAGLGALLGLGALIYGGSQSIFTGKLKKNLTQSYIRTCCLKLRVVTELSFSVV